MDAILTLIGSGFSAVWWLIPIIAMLIGYKFVLRVFGIVVIPEDQIGVVTKKWGMKTLPDGKIIALNGEAGIQADTLAPGLHMWLWPWQFSVAKLDFVTIPAGHVGVVEARDGNPLVGGRVLARAVECDAFQDARTFLSRKGERGTQISVIPPGTYRINTLLFKVMIEEAEEVPENSIGVVTTLEGAPLPTGEIAGPEVPNHSLFQNGQAFLDNGGTKGLQTQVILAGRYFINPRFAIVEHKPLTDVPIAHVGVVTAYVGIAGKDVSGDKFKHGNLVEKGQRGVWMTPLDPGRYPINPHCFQVDVVPTQNVVLNWANNKSEAHKLDERLSTITVRSSDGFTFNLDVAQIIHIPSKEAPLVIARFGSVMSLVTQVLEPTIGNYFRNAAQNSDVIEFLRNRQQRQNEAKAAIQAALNEYNVSAVDTLIGDIVPPEALMKTLTDRKVAEQSKVTYETQRLAEVTRKELEQAKAVAATQAKVVDSERQVQIAEFQAQAKVKTAEGDATASIKQAEGAAQASVKKAEGDAKSKRLNADADAAVLQAVGNAEAGKTLAVGNAEAEVIQRKTNAVGQGNFALIEIGKALAKAGQPLVPQVVMDGAAGGNGGGSASLVNLLLAQAIKAASQPQNVVVAPIVSPPPTSPSLPAR